MQRLEIVKLFNLRRTIILFIVIINFIECFNISFAHPGRTDSNGGHYDRSTGEYHYHNDGYIEESSTNDNVDEKLMLDDTAINNAQTKTENKILQEQIYSKQNTISRLNNMIVEKNEEIEKLKKG